MQNPFGGVAGAASSAASASLNRAQIRNVDADTATKLAKLPESDVKGDVWNVIRKLIQPMTDSSHSSAGSIKSRDLPPPTGVSSADSGKDWLTQLTEPEDTRSPFHKFVDQIGEWNPYGF